VLNLYADESVTSEFNLEEGESLMSPVGTEDRVPTITMTWENYNTINPDYELSEEYKSIIKEAFKHKFGELMFFDPPFSLMHDWYNVQMQTGRFVVDPETLRNGPRPVMRSLGDMLGLYVPDYILLFYVEQYPHLQLKSNVRLCGDPTRLIREYVSHYKGTFPLGCLDKEFYGKRVPIPAKLITKYTMDNRIPFESWKSITPFDIIDHCFPYPEEEEFDIAKFKLLKDTDIFQLIGEKTGVAPHWRDITNFSVEQAKEELGRNLERRRVAELKRNKFLGAPSDVTLSGMVWITRRNGLKSLR